MILIELLLISSFQNMNTSTIPPYLQTLFEMMNFLGVAKKDCKPCFNTKRYVDRNSYWGSLFRWNWNEKQSTYGNGKIRSCCESASQAYELYKDSQYETIILTKILKLRQGLLEIRNTYAKDEDEIDTVNHIDDSIMILDLKIPHNIKLNEGLVPPVSRLPIPNDNSDIKSNEDSKIYKRIDKNRIVDNSLITRKVNNSLNARIDNDQISDDKIANDQIESNGQIEINGQIESNERIESNPMSSFDNTINEIEELHITSSNVDILSDEVITNEVKINDDVNVDDYSNIKIDDKPSNFLQIMDEINDPINLPNKKLKNKNKKK